MKKKLHGNSAEVAATPKARELTLETFYADFIKKYLIERHFDACGITIKRRETRQTHECLFVLGARQSVRFTRVTRRLIFLFLDTRVRFLGAYWSPGTFRLS